MTEENRLWLDVEAAALKLGLPVAVVKEAVRKGELPALEIGGNIRISLDNALKITFERLFGDGHAKPEMSAVPDEPAANKEIGILMPVGLEWLKDLTPGEDYTHGWPQRREDYGKDSSEVYLQVQDGEIGLLSEQLAVKVGRATRFGRGRLTVFFKKIAICEFMETADGAHWASLVKPNGKKVLRPGETPPPLYQRARLEPYRQITDYKTWSGGSGIGIPKGIAVVIPIDDYRGAVHHAVARWLGKRGHMAEASR